MLTAGMWSRCIFSIPFGFKTTPTEGTTPAIVSPSPPRVCEGS